MCGHRHYHHRASFEQQHQPVERRDRTLRVSDRERDEVADQLRDHAAQGRLTADELDERVGQALSARTGAELDALTADLPRSRPRTEARDAARPLTVLAGLAVLLVALWLVTGAGYFWPVWILGFMAFGVLKRGRMRGPHWT